MAQLLHHRIQQLALGVISLVYLVGSLGAALPTRAASDCVSSDIWQVGSCQGLACCSIGYVCVEKTFKTGTDEFQQRLCQVAPPAEEESELAATPIKFAPQVTIPSSITIAGKELMFRQGKGITVTGDTIAQYLSVFYKFFIAMLAVAAVVMVMWGGFKRIMAVGSPEKIADANDSIVSAITGLVLVLISYSLLSLINPALVSFKTIGLQPVTRIEFEDIETDEEVAPAAQPVTVPQLAVIKGDNISNPGSKVATPALISSLQAAATALFQQQVHVIVTSGTRTEAAQRGLILKNCQNLPGSPTCNPKSGRPNTCTMFRGPLSCPHTSGQAVDVWASQGADVPISQADCMSDKAACERDPAMAALIAAMRAQGFCKLDSEPWHFEKPVVSVGRCR